jgi:glucose 1-dehydrogenase
MSTSNAPAAAGHSPPAPLARRFTDKICLVTGGGSGIGRAACERLAAEGGRVVVADLNVEHGQAVAQALNRGDGQSRRDDGERAVFVRCDVGDPAQVRAAIQAAVGRWGRLDVLVNDAAIMTFQPVVDLPEADWDKVLAVNLRSIFLFSKYAVPHMPPGGAIVNISSVHAHESEIGVAPYAASKGAMEAFSRVLALELEKKKIRVNCVAPGAVNTPMLWNNPNVKSGREQIRGAVGEPADLAAAICFLASPEARFVNGTTLVVDGARLDIL